MNNNNKRKRLFASIIVIIIILAMILPMLAFLVPVFADSKVKFEVTADIGFDNTYKVGVPTDFEFVIQNNGSDFEGEVQIKAQLSIDYNGTRSNAIYSYALSLASGGSKKVNFDITLQSISKSFDLIFVDKNGKEVEKQTFSVNAIAPSSRLVATLSDDKNSLNYISNISYYDSWRGIDVIIGDSFMAFSEKDFPKEYSELCMFDILVIDDFDMLRLTNQQIENIEKWVVSGRTMIIGLGEGYEKVINAFPDSFISIDSFNKASLEDVILLPNNGGSIENLLWEAEYNEPDNIAESGNLVYIDEKFDYVEIDNESDWYAFGLSLIKIDAVEFFEEIKGSDNWFLETENLEKLTFAFNNAVENNDYVDLSFRVDKGAGKVIAFAGSLKDKVANISGIKSYSESCIKLGLEETFVDKGYYNEEFDVSYVLSGLPYYGSLQIAVMLIFIAVYIVVIGLVLFKVLKKKDKLKLAWGLIPSFALGLTVIIFIVSLSSNYRNPFINAVKIIELPDNGVVAPYKSSFLAFSPKNGTIAVDFGNEDVPSVSQTNYYRDYHYQQYGSTETEVKKEVDLFKITSGDKNIAEYYEMMNWDSMAFKRNGIMEVEGNIEADLKVDAFRIVGTLTNNTGYELYDVLISNFIGVNKIEKIGVGETVDVDFELDIYNAYSGYYYYRDLVGKAFPCIYNYSYGFGFGGYNGYGDAQESLSREEKRIQNIQGEIYSSYLSINDSYQNNYGGYQGANSSMFDILTKGKIEFDIIAYNFDAIDIENIKISNKKPMISSVNAFVKTIVCDIGNIDQIKINSSSLGMNLIEPANYTNLFNDYDGVSFYNESEIERDFVVNFSIPSNWIVEIIDNENNFRDMEIYNFNTDNWDILNDGFSSRGEDYVKDNQILVKYPKVQPYESIVINQINVTVSKSEDSEWFD